MWVYFHGTPTWRPENSVNIWNLLWLFRQLIIFTEQPSIYISTPPNILTPEYAKNHEISMYFPTNPFVSLFHAPAYIALQFKAPKL